jgi:hypothetical protein
VDNNENVLFDDDSLILRETGRIQNCSFWSISVTFWFSFVLIPSFLCSASLAVS